MLIDFFFTLRDAKVPVTIKEFLTCWKRWKRTSSRPRSTSSTISRA
jgi:uncharacterized protein with von Willebrand factor type A (vWA) domain